jgi:hypothetical protein
MFLHHSHHHHHISVMEVGHLLTRSGLIIYSDYNYTNSTMK